MLKLRHVSALIVGQSSFLGAVISTVARLKAKLDGSAVIAATEQKEAMMPDTINQDVQDQNQMLTTHCKRCGRALKNEDSQRLGYGKSCYIKSHQTMIQPRLFELKKVIKHEDH